MPIITKVYFSHPDMALGGVISSLPEVEIRVLQEASTDPVGEKSFFVVETQQIEAFERELSADHTVENAQQVSHYEDWPVYSIEFTPDTLLLGSVVTEYNGFALSAYQHDGGRIERWQLPDRKALQSIWEYAKENSFEFSIRNMYNISNNNNSGLVGLTEKQKTTLFYAYKNGYFQKPSEITLEEVADNLGISTTAASGRIKRGVKNIIETYISDLD